MTMPRTFTVVALAAVLAFPTAATAKTFRGKTSQHLPVSLTTGADGVPTKGKIRWKAPCQKQGYSVRGATGWSPPFDQATPDILVDGPKSYRTKVGGERHRITVTMKINRHGERWRGTIALRVLVSRKGKVIDDCQFKRVTFTVR